MNKDLLAYKLKEYVSSGILPMHMPGHKRKVPSEISQALTDIYSMDVTEVEGTDNLHDAAGIIRESMDFTKKVYKSKESFYLINGSSCGILAGVRACLTAKKEKAPNIKPYIVIAENAHFSVYNAVQLMNITPVYVESRINDMGIAEGCDRIRLERLLEEYKDKDIVAAVVTSPGYEGVVSDIEAIAALVHKADIPLLVDEAHGAHLTFTDRAVKMCKDLGAGACGFKIPPSALSLGADIVVQSLHKTLPSLTQTAVCHINSELVNERHLKDALHIFETSSPSYILLSSIDACIRYMAEHGEETLSYLKNLYKFRSSINACRHIHLWQGEGEAGYDFTKLVIYSDDMSGITLADILRNEYNIETEMAELRFVLAYSTVCDTKEDLDRLKEALIDIDRGLAGRAAGSREESELDRAYLGNTAARDIYVYPPGVPIVKKNDLIDQKKFDLLNKYIKKGKKVYGLGP